MSAARTPISSEEEIQQLSVHLRPVFGIAPRVYVPVVWGLVVVAALVALFLLPGLINYGSEVTVESAPSGAQVRIDGVRRGTTPLTVFVESGQRTVSVQRGPASVERVESIPGRRIASLILPRRYTVRVALRATVDRDDTDVPLADFSAWSLVGPPSAQFQQPPVAGDLARTIWSSSPSASQRDVAEYTLRNLLSHARGWQAPDVAHAAVRSSVPGAAPGPVGLSALVQRFIQFDNEYEHLHIALEALVADTSPGAAVLRDTGWLQARYDRVSTDLLVASVGLDEGRPPAARVREVAGREMVTVPPGRYIIGYPLRDARNAGRVVDFDREFLLDSTEVSRLQYAQFVAAMPQWAPEEATSLTARGLVDGDYLADWPGDWRRWLEGDVPAAAALQPVRHVSAYAAEAYAAWVDATVGAIPGWSGWEVRLPTAAEFEYTAFLDSLGETAPVLDAAQPQPVDQGLAGALGGRHLVGNLWEWTSSWYSVRGTVLPPDVGDQRVVMGGSYVSAASFAAGVRSDLPTHASRGGQPPAWATPYLGFRLALVPEGSDGRR